MIKRTLRFSAGSCRRFLFCFLGLAVATAMNARAEVIPALSAALTNAISGETSAVNACPFEPTSGALPDSGDWDLNWFFFTFSPQVTFGINHVLSFTVQPELDLIWQRIPPPAP